MKLFKISKNNKDYILNAQDKVDAVKKLRDSQAIKIADRSLIGRKVKTSSKYLGKVVDVEYDGRNIQLKVELLEGPGAGQTIYQRLDNIKLIDSAIKDARPDRDTVFKIEKAANNIRTNNISVAVNIDADKDGAFIKEMYINTSGKWLETPQEADAYLRDLSNAIKFFKENYKYLGK